MYSAFLYANLPREPRLAEVSMVSLRRRFKPLETISIGMPLAVILADKQIFPRVNLNRTIKVLIEQAAHNGSLRANGLGLTQFIFESGLQNILDQERGPLRGGHGGLPVIRDANLGQKLVVLVKGMLGLVEVIQEPVEPGAAQNAVYGLGPFLADTMHGRFLKFKFPCLDTPQH